MTLKQKLLKRLPKKYHRYIEDIEREEGLIDNLKYMLYFKKEYSNTEEYGGSYGVSCITEAIEVIKNLSFQFED